MIIAKEAPPAIRRSWAFGCATANAFRQDPPIKSEMRFALIDSPARACCICHAPEADAQTRLGDGDIFGLCLDCCLFTKQPELGQLPRSMRARILDWAIYNAVAS